VVWLFTLGLVAGVYRSLPLFFLVVALFAVRAVLLRSRAAWIGLALAACCGATGWTAIDRADADCAAVARAAERAGGGRVRLTGWVAEFPQAGRYGSTFVFATTLEGRRVRLWMRSGAFDVNYGEVLEVDARLVKESRTPTDFFTARVIAGEARARFADVRRLDAVRGCPLLRRVLWPMHRAARTRLARALGAESALPVGLLLGERGLLDRAAYEAVRTLGIVHLLALSGMHLTMIALLAVAATHWTPRRRAAFVALALSIYVGVVGDIDSLTRAYTMALLLLAARALVRPPRPVDALGKALLIMLLASPTAILSVGLQLSFAATLAVLGCLARLPAALSRPAAAGSRWRRALLACARAAATAFVVSVAVEVFIAPLQAHHFGRVSVVGPLATVAFLAPVSIVQGLALAASFDLPIVGGSIAWLLSWASGITRDAIVAASSFAPAPVALAPPQWAVYYAAVCVVCWRPRVWGAWGVAAVGVAVAFLLR
jgi:competence protein ComEC